MLLSFVVKSEHIPGDFLSLSVLVWVVSIEVLPQNQIIVGVEF